MDRVAKIMAPQRAVAANRLAQGQHTLCTRRVNSLDELERIVASRLNGGDSPKGWRLAKAAQNAEILWGHKGPGKF